MAADTTPAAPGTRTAAPEPLQPAAKLLARLTPDELYPARFTGPHAWHPWGLTIQPPTDHVVRLVSSNGDPDSLDRLLDHLQAQLRRPTWPPLPLLQVDRHGCRLDCQDTDGLRGVLHIEQYAAGWAPVGRDVVSRDGWPVVDEVVALSDRLVHIDADQPDCDDLADLARWVHHKMTAPTPTRNLAYPLSQLLCTQAAQQPHASARLATLLERGIAQADKRDVGPLSYLQDQHRQAQAREQWPGHAATRARAR